MIINSHTQGEYLDDPKFFPILEAAEALGTPIYLHPNTAPKNFIQPMLDAGLDGAIWGFAVETGTHLLRLITKGVFDLLPEPEAGRRPPGRGAAVLDVPPRLHARRHRPLRPLRGDEARSSLSRAEYLRRNIWVTTSGMAWAPAIMFCREVLGPDRVMYAMDYPYEYQVNEVRWQDDLPLTTTEKKQFYQTNAEQVFGLPKGD